MKYALTQFMTKEYLLKSLISPEVLFFETMNMTIAKTLPATNAIISIVFYFPTRARLTCTS